MKPIPSPCILPFPSTNINASPMATDLCRRLTEVTSPERPTVLRLDAATYSFDREGTTPLPVRASGDCTSSKYTVFDLCGVENLIIDGQGAEWLFRDRLTPVVMRNCRHITLRNFTIDFSFSRYGQGTVTESDEGGFTLFIDPAVFNVTVDGEGHIGFGCASEIFTTRETRILLANEVFGKLPWDYIFAGDTVCSQENLPTSMLETDAVRLDESHVRFVYRDCSRRPVYSVGETFVFCYEPRENVNIYMEDCEDIRLENVRMYRGGGMGIVAHMCRDVELDRVRIEPRPGRGECRSTTADGMYFVQCHGRLHIHDCTIADTLDDALNIHGIYTRVETVTSPDTLVAGICFEAHRQISPFLAGCEIVVLDGETLSERTRARVRSVEILDDARTRLHFDCPIDAREGDYIESLLAAEFIFENNHVLRCPHLRISDPGKKIIRGNHFEETHAILIYDLFRFWYESGPVTDVLIEENRFDNCPCTGMDYPIQIDCARGSSTTARHRGIRILHNTFRNANGHAVCARYAQGLSIADNEFSHPAHAVYTEQCDG